MNRARLAYLAPLALAVAVAVAGCGSSSHSNSSAAAAASSRAPAPTTSTAAAHGTSERTSLALISTKRAKLGTVLAYGPKRLTVYLFEGDRSGVSNCSGACAKFWPPVTGHPKASGQAQASDLGTLSRPDGSTQVTYKGHPLYLFVKDRDDGDTYGEGVKAFGAEWYALDPAGAKVDKS